MQKNDEESNKSTKTRTYSEAYGKGNCDDTRVAFNDRNWKISIPEIANASGVPRTSIYQFFPSKYDLYDILRWYI